MTNSTPPIFATSGPATQRLYAIVDDLNKQSEETMAELTAAVREGDDDTMHRTFQEMTDLAQKQNRATRLLRRHALRKAQRLIRKVQGNG